jgi:hypothetical protein
MLYFEEVFSVCNEDTSTDCSIIKIYITIWKCLSNRFQATYDYRESYVGIWRYEYLSLNCTKMYPLILCLVLVDKLQSYFDIFQGWNVVHKKIFIPCNNVTIYKLCYIYIYAFLCHRLDLFLLSNDCQQNGQKSVINIYWHIPN